MCVYVYMYCPYTVHLMLLFLYIYTMAAAGKGIAATRKRNQRRRKARRCLQNGVKELNLKLNTCRRTVLATKGRRQGFSVATRNCIPELELVCKDVQCISRKAVLPVTDSGKVHMRQQKSSALTCDNCKLIITIYCCCLLHAVGLGKGVFGTCHQMVLRYAGCC